jgi:hypothetical protein
MPVYEVRVEGDDRCQTGHTQALNRKGRRLAAMVTTGVVGLALERLVIRPTRGTYILIPFIATAGVSFVLENGAQRLFGPDPVPVPSIIPLHIFNVGGVRVTSMQLTTLLTAVVIMIALRYYVRHTKWGRATRAMAERPEVATAPHFLKAVQEKFHPRRVAIIYDITQDALRAEAELIRHRAAKYGFEIVAFEAFRVNDVDFRAQLATIETARPEWLGL